MLILSVLVVVLRKINNYNNIVSQPDESLSAYKQHSKVAVYVLMETPYDYRGLFGTRL